MARADTTTTQFLNALWFCTPEWPPREHNFNEQVQLHKRRIVELENWETEPNFDSKGKIYSSSY